MKLEDLKNQGMSESDLNEQTARILEKACICRDLGDGALLKYGIQESKKQLSPAVCPGPNIAYFSKICSLKEMVDHIYGRISVIDPSRHRPHVFLNELKIYIDYFKELVCKAGLNVSKKDVEYFSEFKQNLLAGIEYYMDLAKAMYVISSADREKFLSDLLVLAGRLESHIVPAVVSPPTTR
jgi:hypothetical protein